MSLCWNQGFLSPAATVGLPVFCRKEEGSRKEYEERHKKILEDAKRNHEKAVCFLRKSIARLLFTLFLSLYILWSTVLYPLVFENNHFSARCVFCYLGNLLPQYQCCEAFKSYMAQKDLERAKSTYCPRVVFRFPVAEGTVFLMRCRGVWLLVGTNNDLKHSIIYVCVYH